MDYNELIETYLEQEIDILKRIDVSAVNEVLNLLEAGMKREATIYVFGNDYDTKDGTCIRDYIHVNDLADAHIRALNYLYQGNPSQTFNLGNGEGYSVLEIINAAKEVTQLPIHVTMAPRRAGDPAKLVADNSKAKEILGWHPSWQW